MLQAYNFGYDYVANWSSPVRPGDDRAQLFAEFQPLWRRLGAGARRPARAGAVRARDRARRAAPSPPPLDRAT
jgi:hypothetical protein